MVRTNFLLLFAGVRSDSPLLLLAGATFASPVTAAVCFWKGKRVLGLMGAAALPAAGLIFILANNAVADSDGGLEDNIAFGVFIAMALMLVIAGLAIPSFFGAVRLARPNSRWASKRYDEDKMNRALTRAASSFFDLPVVSDNDTAIEQRQPLFREPPSDPYPPFMNPPADPR